MQEVREQQAVASAFVIVRESQVWVGVFAAGVGPPSPRVPLVVCPATGPAFISLMHVAPDFMHYALGVKCQPQR